MTYTPYLPKTVYASEYDRQRAEEARRKQIRAQMDAIDPQTDPRAENFRDGESELIRAAILIQEQMDQKKPGPARPPMPNALASSGRAGGQIPGTLPGNPLQRKDPRLIEAEKRAANDPAEALELRIKKIWWRMRGRVPARTRRAIDFAGDVYDFHDDHTDALVARINGFIDGRIAKAYEGVLETFEDFWAFANQATDEEKKQIAYDLGLTAFSLIPVVGDIVDVGTQLKDMKDKENRSTSDWFWIIIGLLPAVGSIKEFRKFWRIFEKIADMGRNYRKSGRRVPYRAGKTLNTTPSRRARLSGDGPRLDLRGAPAGVRRWADDNPYLSRFASGALSAALKEGIIQLSARDPNWYKVLIAGASGGAYGVSGRVGKEYFPLAWLMDFANATVSNTLNNYVDENGRTLSYEFSRVSARQTVQAVKALLIYVVPSLLEVVLRKQLPKLSDGDIGVLVSLIKPHFVTALDWLANITNTTFFEDDLPASDLEARGDHPV